jgi:hypothetical protein
VGLLRDTKNAHSSPDIWPVATKKKFAREKLAAHIQERQGGENALNVKYDENAKANNRIKRWMKRIKPYRYDQ